jgi:hypothetical protein
MEGLVTEGNTLDPTRPPEAVHLGTLAERLGAEGTSEFLLVLRIHR